MAILSPWTARAIDTGSAMDTPLDPTLDVVFKLLLVRRPTLLVPLVEAIAPGLAPVGSVEILDPELLKESVEHKGAVVDVRVRLADGHQIDLEMQQIPNVALRGRVVYYWARMMSGQLRPGDGHEQLARCTVVLFMATAGAGAPPRFHSIYRPLEIHDQTPLTDLFEVHWIELTKRERAEDEPALARWARFLMAETDEEREALAEEDPVMQEAKQALDELSANPHARLLAAARERDRQMHRYEMALEREEGAKEGFLRSVEIVAEMLGLPLDDGRRRSLALANAKQLEALLVHIREHHAWPS